VLGVAVFIYAVRLAQTSGTAWMTGAVFGLAAFGGLLWFFSKLGLIAVVPLVLLHGAYFALFGRLVWALRTKSGISGWVMTVGLWAGLELARDNFPLGGFSWGSLGYSVSNMALLRLPARLVGTAGLGVILVAVAAALAMRRWRLGAVVVSFLLILGWVLVGSTPLVPGDPVRVAVVQGSTPCPFEHCPDERYGTYRQHLELTGSIGKGDADLVVWAEGSTGSLNADPMLVPAVAQQMGSQAVRIGAYLLAGGDRPISETEWINANVLFDPAGEIVGEYRKRHPVPFGEYVPARRFFGWVEELAAVPRDMVRGAGPVVFDTTFGKIGSVISFEGAFARYSRETAAAGARVLVVATNEASYDRTPATDQFIGITRMRAVETGIPVIHAAVTGRSVIIQPDGELGKLTGLGTRELLVGTVIVTNHGPTPFVRFGNWLVWLTLAAAGSVFFFEKARRPPVGVAAVSGSKP